MIIIIIVVCYLYITAHSHCSAAVCRHCSPYLSVKCCCPSLAVSLARLWWAWAAAAICSWSPKCCIPIWNMDSHRGTGRAGWALIRPTTYPAGGLGGGQISLAIIEESPVRIILKVEKYCQLLVKSWHQLTVDNLGGSSWHSFFSLFNMDWLVSLWSLYY